MSKTPTSYPFVRDTNTWKGLVSNEIRAEAVLKKKVLSRDEVRSVVIRLKKDLLVKDYEEKKNYEEIRRNRIYYKRRETIDEHINNIQLKSIESYSDATTLYADFLMYIDRISGKTTSLLFQPFKVQSIVIFLQSLSFDAFNDIIVIIMTSFLETKDSYGFDRFKKESVYTLFQLLCNIFADQYSYDKSKEMEVNKIYDLDLLINWNLISSINRGHQIYQSVSSYIDNYYEKILLEKKKTSVDNGFFNSIKDSKFKELYEQHTLKIKQQDFIYKYENKFSGDLFQFKDNQLYEYHYNQYQSKYQHELDLNRFDGIALDAYIYESKESILLQIRNIETNKLYASRINFEHPERSAFLSQPFQSPFVYSNNSDDYSASVKTEDNSRMLKHALLQGNENVPDVDRSETLDSEMTLDNDDVIKEQQEEILDIENKVESPKNSFSFGFNNMSSPRRGNFSSY